MDFIDGAVPVDVEPGVRKGGGQLLLQAANDLSFELFLDVAGHIVECGDPGLNDIAGSVLGTNSDRESRPKIKLTVILPVAGGAGGRAIGVAPKPLVVSIGAFELVVDFIEDGLETLFPAFQTIQ